MKKILIILLTALLFVSCTHIKNNETNIEKRYETLLNDWKLDELGLLLDKSTDSDNNKTAERYKKLLQERREDKAALEKMIESFKTQLESNNFENIEIYFNDSFINRKILEELRNIDFSNMKIIYTKPEFYKNNAKNTAAIIFIDNVRYFQFNYKLSNKKWSIMEIKDGR